MFLEGRIPTLKQYLYDCWLEEDWHGCMDASADLREVEAELKGLNAASSDKP